MAAICFLLPRPPLLPWRFALPNQRGRMIVGQGLRLSLAGIMLGSLAAAVLTGLMEGTLFRVSATGPAAFVAIAGIFLTVGLPASFVPAWRVTRIDPLDAPRAR